MTKEKYHGEVKAFVETEDNGSNPVICVEIANGDMYPFQNLADAYLSIEDAYRLAEEIDAAIDLMARTDKMWREAKEARIAALKAALDELEA